LAVSKSPHGKKKFGPRGPISPGDIFTLGPKEPGFLETTFETCFDHNCPATRIQRFQSASIAAFKTIIAQRATALLLFDQLFFGLSLGFGLLLASIGLANYPLCQWRVNNGGHGEMIMLGAYTTYVCAADHAGTTSIIRIWVAIPAAVFGVGF